MDVSWELKMNELHYEVEDWTDFLLMSEFVSNFEDLSQAGKDLIVASVIRFVTVGLYGIDAEIDMNNIDILFNRLIKEETVTII